MERKRMKMVDPVFGPGEARTAIATFPVKPAGLACTAELWLSRDGGATKDATSGEIPFTSTGVDQSVSLPVSMPVDGGFAYTVLIDPKVEGVPIPGYIADEEVVIPWMGAPQVTWQ